MRIAIAGSGRLAAYLYFALRESRHEIVAVIQNGRHTRGWKRRVIPVSARYFGSSLSMTGQAVRIGVPLIWLDKMDDEELTPLRRTAPDLILVGGFSVILKKPVLELPRIGCLNCHSSLLPKHRGPNPFQAIILQNEKESGVTFHIMEEGIDSGDIVDQIAYPIEPADTMIRVYHKACELSRDRVVEVIDRIEEEGLHGTPQNEAEATYDKKAKPEEAWIDWRLAAEEIDRRIRGLAPSPMPRFLFQGRIIFVLRSRFDPAPVNAAPGTVLATRPFVKVATGEGVLILVGAFMKKPLPWRFPAPWAKPVKGDVLPVERPAS